MGNVRFLLVVEVVNELVPLVDDGHQLFEEQLLPQLLRLRLLPICTDKTKQTNKTIVNNPPTPAKNSIQEANLPSSVSGIPPPSKFQTIRNDVVHQTAAIGQFFLKNAIQYNKSKYSLSPFQ